MTPRAVKPSAKPRVKLSGKPSNGRPAKSPVIARLAERLPLGNGARGTAQDPAPECAPCGAYEVTADQDERLSFCHCQEPVSFTLSIDAALQHVNEGRIHLDRGCSLPQLLAYRGH